MRNVLAAASVAAFALVPLAPVERLGDAPRVADGAKAIEIAHDPQTLAAAASPRLLADLTLDLLHQFQSTPIRGRHDSVGVDRLRVWDWSYMARAAIVLYLETRDRRLIDGVLRSIDDYAAEAQAPAASSAFGWYTVDTVNAKSFREVPVNGLIMAPVVDLLLAARHDAQLAGLIAGRRERLLSLMERAADGTVRDYTEDRGNGFFRQNSRPEANDVEPLNLASVYAEPLLGLWQLTQNPEYLREVTGIARTWKTLLAAPEPNGVSWPYWPRPAPGQLLQGPRERLNKGAVGVLFPRAAYAAGVVIDRGDIEKLAGLPLATSVIWLDRRHVLIRGHFDISAHDYLSPNVKGRDNPLAMGAWYVFDCLKPGLAESLDPVMFGMDSKFFQHYRLALYGYATHLAHETRAEACDSRPALTTGAGARQFAPQALAGNDAAEVAGAE